MNTTSNFHGLEPFPRFIDSAPPNSANYFSSPMAMASIQLLTSSKASHKARMVIPAKIINNIRLRYYQFEVTFGVYMMTPKEKVIFNTIILTILAFWLYALSWGLQLFLVSSVCRMLYYITGSIPTARDLCSTQ
jgi:hypothetical protein